MAHPQVVAREDFITINDDVFGELLLPNVLPRLTRTPGRIERPVPGSVNIPRRSSADCSTYRTRR